MDGKPHVGTDRLVRILRSLREHLRAKGGEVRFSTDVKEVLVEGDRATGVRLACGARTHSTLNPVPCV